jgi:hypothetical protein
MAQRKSEKLTLVVDPGVVQSAKAYAAAHNTSLSTLIESYLKQLTESEKRSISQDPDTWPPVTRSLVGALRSNEDETPELEKLKEQHLIDTYLND